MSLQYLFLIILGVVSLVYLSTLLFKATIFQFILKCCIIPLILAVYLSGGNVILIPVVLALIFAWAGDIFLVKIDNLLCFRLGLASFLIGHICYITAMFGFAQPYNIPVLIISVIIAVGLGDLLFRIIKPSPEMKIPVLAYETAILVMAIFAIQLFSSQSGAFGAFVLAGSICFVVSDSALALVTFQKKPFYVLCMATYIAAQLLITLGFCQLVTG